MKTSPQMPSCAGSSASRANNFEFYSLPAAAAPSFINAFRASSSAVASIVNTLFAMSFCRAAGILNANHVGARYGGTFDKYAALGVVFETLS
mmetsp:Transcript_2204/g.3396  ORF Transcript_2204/g.3396 Transcript_2204/m.3396 type:complete len:92 (+) Transcript_2204:118-393(+)